MPSVAPGVEGGAGATAGAFELSARGAIFARSTTDVPSSNSVATSSFLLVTIEARVAWISRPTSNLELAPFGGIGLAWLRGEGRGTEADGSASDSLPMPFGGLEKRAALTRWAQVYAGIDGGVPLGRSSFRFQGAEGAVHEPALISMGGSAGLRFSIF